MYNFADEIKYLNKGRIISITAHILLLLIAFFFVFKVEVEQIPEEEVQEVFVDLPPEMKIPRVKPQKFSEEASSNSTKANADEGESRPINPEVQKVEVNDPKPPAEKFEKVLEETPKTTPTNTDPTPPVIIKSKVDDSPVKVQDSDIEIEKPKKDNVPTTGTSTKPNTLPSKTSTTTSPKPGAGTVGSPTGTGNKPQSQTDGNGKGKSDKGTGLGSDKGTDVTSGTGNSSDGTGEYDGSGNGIFNRKVIYRNVNKLPMVTSGKVVTKICVNRLGNVTYTEINTAETTIKDRAILKQTLAAARGYKYQPDPKAPAEQCGKLTITLDINRLK